jgi:hypothetical protein
MMKNLRLIALTAALSGTAMVALAQAPTPTPAPKPAPTQQTAPKEAAPPAIASTKGAPNQLVELTAMDANRDGLVSRQEYMTHYEGLYGKIKKDSAGMISLKDFASTSPIAAVQ